MEALDFFFRKKRRFKESLASGKRKKTPAAKKFSKLP
jgi:hypothetical protein